MRRKIVFQRNYKMLLWRPIRLKNHGSFNRRFCAPAQIRSISAAGRISVNSPAKSMQAFRRIAKDAILHNLCPKGMGISVIFGIIFWIAAIINQTYISDYHGAVSVRYKEPILTGQEIDNIIEAMISKQDRNIPEVTLWQREEDIILTNEEVNTSVSIGLITVAGDMTKVYPDSLLYGGYLPKGDYIGCIIDKNTAYKLFHTENAVGLTISLNNKDYIINGIMQGIGNTMIIQEEKQVLTEKEGIKYSCIELVFSDTENAKYLAENFINTNSLGTPTAYIDGYMYQKISYLLIHIPVLSSAMILILYFARKVNKLKASRVLFASGWFGIILLSAILIRITDVHFYYSSLQLPTLWSDFDFWGNQWKMLKNSFGGTEGSILFYKDIMLKKRMVFVLSGVMVAVLSQAVGIRVSRAANKL